MSSQMPDITDEKDWNETAFLSLQSTHGIFSEAADQQTDQHLLLTASLVH